MIIYYQIQHSYNPFCLKPRIHELASNKNPKTTLIHIHHVAHPTVNRDDATQKKRSFVKHASRANRQKDM